MFSSLAFQLHQLFKANIFFLTKVPSLLLSLDNLKRRLRCFHVDSCLINWKLLLFTCWSSYALRLLISREGKAWCSKWFLEQPVWGHTCCRSREGRGVLVLLSSISLCVSGTELTRQQYIFLFFSYGKLTQDRQVWMVTGYNGLRGREYSSHEQKLIGTH